MVCIFLLKKVPIEGQQFLFVMAYLQGGAFAQIKWAIVSESLRLLKTIAHGRSGEMSDREQIAQVAQDKWAICSGRSEEMSDSLKKILAKKSKLLFNYVLFKV